MSMTDPGPSSIETSSGLAVHSIMDGDLWTKRDYLVQRWRSTHERVKTVTNIANGEWYVEWPDLSQTPEAPSVANLVELGINHWQSIGGAVLPSIRVPVTAADDRAYSKVRARKRERRLRELWETSNMSELAALLWGDYAGAGYAVVGTWVNFDEQDPSKRNPYLLRYDPRHTYLMKDNLGNVTELLVARQISKTELAAMSPWIPGKDWEEEVEEWFWYTQDRIMYILVDASRKGRAANRMAVLVNEENDMGFVPVWEVVRPSFDGQRRGIFDQTLHLLRTMHRLMTMTIYSVEENSFPALAEYDTINPDDFGPGRIVHLRSPDSRIERLGPASHFDVKDLVSRLGEDAKAAAAYPQQLSGEPGASIVSARGINASMGALDARLAVAHKQFEVGFGKASGFLLAMDEIFCNGKKQILGDYRDKRKAEDFEPKKDIAGQWVARCTYGIGAGSDPANVEVRIAMQLQDRLISRETARAQLPFLEDPDAEPLRMARETAQDSLLQGVYAMAGQGDPRPAAKLLELLRKDDVDWDHVVGEMVEFLGKGEEEAAAAAGAAGGGGALGAAQAAESLARGGIPGNAEQGPPAQSLGLPPLGQLMGQDSRMVS